VELDRQSIERRDFPIARRGYDPAAVDAHLRALAAEVDELRWHSTDSRAGESLGAAAAGHVQSILDAAEASAADIERQAADDARRTRDEAARDAERTRTEMAQRTQAHVESVSRAAAVLLARVESMDGEVSALVHSLRAGAGRLAADLGSVETNVSELYDAVSGPAAAVPVHPPTDESESEPEPEWVEPAVEPGAGFVAERVTEPVTEPIPPVGATPPAFAAAPVAAPTEPAAAPLAPPTRVDTVPAPALGGGDPNAGWPAPAAAPQVGESGQATAANGDLDGARLVALNMALNGEPRAQADRYLAENFQLADRAKLLDEVYAAIEG
jgi:DivIVA domain-containing protein